MILVRFQKMTNEQARQWLVANDPEVKRYWLKLGLRGCDLRPAVEDNLYQFGGAVQDGSCFKLI